MSGTWSWASCGDRLLPVLCCRRTVGHSAQSALIYHPSPRLERISQVAPVVKNLPVSARDGRDSGSIPGMGIASLEEGMANHSSILA